MLCMYQIIENTNINQEPPALGPWNSKLNFDNEVTFSLLIFLRIPISHSFWPIWHTQTIHAQCVSPLFAANFRIISGLEVNEKVMEAYRLKFYFFYKIVFAFRLLVMKRAPNFITQTCDGKLNLGFQPRSHTLGYTSLSPIQATNLSFRHFFDHQSILELFINVPNANAKVPCTQ